jgi:arylsulfatase A-like enzyme
VLLVSLDTVRADALTFRDPRAAPNLTALAAEGTVFTQAVSGSSWTLPAHAQIFTGQPPALHRVEVDDCSIDERTPLLTELLAGAGCFTAGLWTGWYLAPEYGFGRGFELYENAMTGGELLGQEFESRVAGGVPAQGWQAQVERERSSHQDVTSERVAGRALEILRGLERDQRAFLFLHLFDPHYDYVPPGRWAREFDPDYAGTLDGRDYYFNPRIWDEQQQRRVVNDRDLEHVVALYRGEIGWVDEQVGRVLAELRASGRLERTLIVVTSDHGEEFFEHGLRGHKLTLYDVSLRVPLLIVLPEALRRSPPAAVAAQVSLSDILPTVLDYAGIEPPPTVFGRSLRPALEGQAFASRPEVSSLTLFSHLEGGRRLVVVNEAVRTPEYKLLRHTSIEPGQAPRTTHVVYTDLVASPDEQRRVVDSPENMAPHAPVRAAWEALETELERMRAIHAANPHQPEEQRTTDMARLLADELRLLGYADGAAAGDSDLSPGHSVPWGLGIRPRLALPPE